MHSHRYCIAPMLDWTDKHARFFLRLFSPNIRLYTEMITTGAIIHGNTEGLLAFNPEEYPLALQLGGSKPDELATCARIATEFGYNEINLNIGCPSNRVQSGQFGACLMAKPSLVADCIHAMTQTTPLPVTIKCRLGIDDLDSYEHLYGFIEKTASAGCKIFIVHARKAWLSGLSPKENREIPPLEYSKVYQLKQDFPELDIVINGGIKNSTDAIGHLDQLEGVMVGREAYRNPGILLDVDQKVFHKSPHNLTISKKSRLDNIAQKMIPYIERSLNQNNPLKKITRHTLGLFNGFPGARLFRRVLSEEGVKPNANVQTWLKAVSMTDLTIKDSEEAII